MRRLPGPASDPLGDGGNSRGSLRVVSGLAANTNSIFCDGCSQPEAANGCAVLHQQEPPVERPTRAAFDRDQPTARSPEREKRSRAFPLTVDLHGRGLLGN